MYYIELEKMLFSKIKYEKNIFYISNYKPRTLKKLVKKLHKLNIKKVVCSNTILNESIIINYLYSNNIDIYNGKILFKKIVKNTFEYLKSLGYELEKYNISILVNDNSELNLRAINNALIYFKNISIITNHISKFSRLEKKLEEEGIIINFSKNKKKSLKKAKFILNIDFPNELINKFNINDECIIINVEEDIIIKRKSFKGINIVSYDLDIEDYDIDRDNFNVNHIFEALVMENKIKNVENIKVTKLIGNRGEIKKEEFINNMQKLS